MCGASFPSIRPALLRAEAPHRAGTWLGGGATRAGEVGGRSASGRSSLAWSVFLHAVAAVFLLLMQAPLNLQPPGPHSHVTLIAPRLSPTTARLKPRFEPRIAPSRLKLALPRPGGRLFRASVKPWAPVSPLQLAAPVELAVEAPPIPSPELPILPVAAPIRTGVLDEARVERAPAARPPWPTRASGFNSGSPPDAPPHPAAKPAPQVGAFGDASTAAPDRHSVAGTAAGIRSAVEILNKPRPRYTTQARSAGIEGEVLLDVLFRASGECQVLRLVHGLGHGLDESAVEAARQIQFRPARRDGLAVDSSAIVHISFELAF